MSKTLDKYIRDNEKSVMANNEENVKAWEEKFNLIMDKVRGHQSKYIKRIFGKFKRGLFPAAQFITLDCLDVQDVPYHIQENSIFVTFSVDLVDNIVEVYNTGHINLNAQESKQTFLAAASMKKLVQNNKGRWMRKTTFKTPTDCADKILTFFDNAMGIVEDTTGGYPYKRIKDGKFAYIA